MTTCRFRRRGRLAWALVLMGLLALPAGGTALAHDEEMATRSTELTVQSLTEVLLDQHQQHYRKARGRDRDERLHVLRELAKERKARLVELAHEDPSAFLRVVQPDLIRVRLPEELHAEVEALVTREGMAETLVVDDFVTRRLIHTLTDQHQRKTYTLHFAVPPEAPLTDLGQVRIKGVLIDQHIVLAALGPTSLEDLREQNFVGSPQRPLGEQRTLVILVNFLDAPSEPFTPAQVHDLVFNDRTGVNAYFAENSYGRTWLTGEVLGWYQVPLAVGTTCPLTDILIEAIKAADGQVDFGRYNPSRLLLMFPRINCGWEGAAVQSSHYFLIPTQEGTINTSKAWVNGNLSLALIAHELGHTFGVGHANSLDCVTTVVDLGKVGCTSQEYGDPFDVMGSARRSGTTGHFNAAAKGVLRWFSQANLTSIGPGDSTTLSIAPLETASSGPQALKFLRGKDGSGFEEWYYLEYRQPTGFDDSLATNTNVISGALVHVGQVYPGSSSLAFSYVLDMTPESRASSEDFLDAALPAGQTFVDPSGIAITALNSTSDALTVRVAIPRDDSTPPDWLLPSH